MTNPLLQIDEDEPDHPVARAWLSRIRRGERATFTLWRKRDGLTHKRAKIYMTFHTPHGEERDHDDWDVDLNEALVREGVRAESATNEAQRLTLMMRYWFSKPEERYDPAFFEAVLVDVARESELAQERSLQEVLERIRIAPATPESPSYAPCKSSVDAILLERAGRSLVRDLRYTEEEAKPILAEALARYLDDRFHVSQRRMLGL